MRELARWLDAAALTEGLMFRRILRPAQAALDDAPLRVIGAGQLTARLIARIIQVRTAAAGFLADDLGRHNLKRSALTAGMQATSPAAQLRRLSRHKSFAVLGEYLKFGTLFDGHALAGLL